jgi:phytoene dehydrogenase-like protein
VKAVVIGSGVDALVAARLLSRAHEVTMVSDAQPAEERGWVPPQVRRVLRLEDAEPEPAVPWAVAPLQQGGRLELWHDMQRSVESIRRVSTRDARRWPEFCARMARLARFFEHLYLKPPPDPLGSRFALRARLLGRQGLVDLMRLLPMPVAELLDDWFESDPLKGILGAAGVMHLQQGPRSGGTAFVFLHHHAGSPPGVFRSPRSAVMGSAGAGPVKAIGVRSNRVTAVALADGTEIPADLVVSGLHPRRTLLELVDPAWLDPELVRGVRNLRDRPVAMRVILQLDRAPRFQRLVLAPSLDYLERAYDDSKYGAASRQPWIEAHAQGERRIEAHVQYLPAGVDAAPLGDVAARMLSEHLDGAIVESAQVAPLGQPNQVELALDQALWMRPLPPLAHYRAPIEGLWLCGPAMHPGAGILGAAGYNCARAIPAR